MLVQSYEIRDQRAIVQPNCSCLNLVLSTTRQDARLFALKTLLAYYDNELAEMLTGIDAQSQSQGHGLVECGQALGLFGSLKAKTKANVAGN